MFGGYELLQTNPGWRDHLLFHEYFHADTGAGLGASHQTGWTGLVLGPDRPARAVDGIITGWHAPGASHLSLLAAVAGPGLVSEAYGEAIRHRYLWHEFGDSCLLLR